MLFGNECDVYLLIIGLSLLQGDLAVLPDSSDELNYSAAQDSSDMHQCSSKSSDQVVPTRRLPFSTDPLDEDPRFQLLCLQAARSVHQMKAVEFDEEYDIMNDKDIEISVVELKLPLGRKFRTMYASPMWSLSLDFLSSTSFRDFFRSNFSRKRGRMLRNES